MNIINNINSALIEKIKFGVYISLVMILMSLIAHIFSISTPAFGWIRLFVYVVTVYIAQKIYRDMFYDVPASFKNLLKDTTLIILFTSVAIMIYTFIFYIFIAPNHLSDTILNVEITLEDRGFSQSEINQVMPVVKAINSPVARGIIVLGSTFVQGFIVALIAALLNKQDPESFENTDNVEEITDTSSDNTEIK